MRLARIFLRTAVTITLAVLVLAGLAAEIVPVMRLTASAPGARPNGGAHAESPRPHDARAEACSPSRGSSPFVAA